jgi:hypothetical protein
VTAIVIDGNVVRDTILAEIRATIDAAGNPPVCLATVLVGDDKPSQSYIRSKQKKAGEAGIQSRHTDLPATASQMLANTPRTVNFSVFIRYAIRSRSHSMTSLTAAPRPPGRTGRRRRWGWSVRFVLAV